MFPRYYYGCSIPDGQSVVLTGGELTGRLVSRYTRCTIYTISTLYLHYVYTISTPRAGWAEDLPSLGTGRAGHGCTSFITGQGDTVSRHV